jgi:hypothetical protein
MGSVGNVSDSIAIQTKKADVENCNGQPSSVQHPKQNALNDWCRMHRGLAFGRQLD